MSAPAAALRSMSSCTLALRALGTTTRPTMPAGAMTAMSRLSPFWLSLVDGQRAELRHRTGSDDFGRRGREVRALPQLEQLFEAARPIGERPLLLQIDLRFGQLAV